ncbi:MAG TPA: DUF6600 domain-containing protein [Rhodanobacteraceae bacterium]
MSRIRLLYSFTVACGLGLLVLGAATAQAQQYDDSQPYDAPQADADTSQMPDRIARLAYISGDVEFQPAGASDWGSVDTNRPMVVGDRLLTGDDGRAVLELGDASVRIANDTAFDFLNLAQDNIQVELSQGTLNVAVRQLAQGENVEVDTPTIAFVAATPGVYRIDDDPSGTGSMVTVFQGSGTVYGENGASRQVVTGTSYRFNDSALANVDVNGIPEPDAFDQFCQARDASYQRYAEQPQYVPQDMIGGDDLDRYGQWNNVPEYGNVWYPSSVPTGWAPYRYGHWAWIDPWGWTWVGDEPWGFAPFHYGRWAYIGSRWGWIPGPVNVRPVYAPALVAFIGGSGFSLSLNLGGGGGPVGWFPLGPRDVYVPWFHASRRYFNNVNVTNIRNVYVNKTVINNFYNDYQAGRQPPFGRNDYRYRNMPNAVTAVPRNVFTGARPVHSAALRLNRAQLARAEVARLPAVTPGRASLGLRNARVQPAVLRGHAPFARPVVARRAPAPRPVAFATREKLIAAQHGQPLTPAQLHRAQPVRAAREPSRVKLVPAIAGAAAVAAGAAALRHESHPAPSLRTNQGFHNQIHPIPARNQPVQRTQPPAAGAQPVRPGFRNQIHPIPARQQPAPVRPGELPSARFRHPEPPATLPRVPVIRPAENAPRPSAQPVRRAPQPSVRQGDVAAQQRARQAELEAQQRQQAAQRQQALQQQRDQQQQQAAAQRREQALQQQQRQAALQQQRQQEAQQQRQAQLEQQRQQQAQQQRQAELQQREVQMQQQRQMQEQRNQQLQQQQRFQTMQREQQVRAQEMRHAPAATHRVPERREPARKAPPKSSGDQPR